MIYMTEHKYKIHIFEDLFQSKTLLLMLLYLTEYKTPIELIRHKFLSHMTVSTNIKILLSIGFIQRVKVGTKQIISLTDSGYRYVYHLKQMKQIFNDTTFM